MNVLQFTKGDTLRPISATLEDQAGNIVDLTASVITFRMVNIETGAVKVNNAAASASGDPTLGVVVYQQTSADMDTPGTYRAWFIRTLGGVAVEHFPREREFEIEIYPDV